MIGSSRYLKLVEHLFLSRHQKGTDQVEFSRDDIAAAAAKLRMKTPKNLGDVIYSFRYRVPLPDSIQSRAPTGTRWVIEPAGVARYRFKAVPRADFQPNPSLAVVKVPDATPGVIRMYGLNDEQSLLAKVRYNRLLDIFTGVACYSLQNHLRTTVPELGQIETDELYVGVHREGVHYVFPVQAKAGRDRISVVQISQDIAMCAAKFPQLPCRPIAAQLMPEDIIALIEFQKDRTGVAIAAEKHYRLVPPEALSAEDLAAYRLRLP